ncbi:MAG: hypothetical protein LQ351_005781 [Letrouitia transgressa]|nr:MAG: hypothetical protein LQ351_005781 [Letrouitia transgressa]
MFGSRSEVQEVLEEYEDLGELQYLVRFTDGHKSEISFTRLIELANGSTALGHFCSDESDVHSSSSNSSSVMVKTRHSRSTRSRDKGFVDVSQIVLSTDDELITGKDYILNRSRNQDRRTSQRKIARPSRKCSSETDNGPLRRQAARATTRPKSYREELPQGESGGESDEPRTKRRNVKGATRLTLRGPVQELRRSDRAIGEPRSMREYDEDEIQEVPVTKGPPKAIGARERFDPLPKDNDFRLRHERRCDVCTERGDNPDKGILVHCQACSLSYHQKCLGPRNSREHLVTKIAAQEFVLQCRRCIGFARQKEPLAPRQELCQVCHKPSETSCPFSVRKTARQEQKEREDNGGEDPEAQIPANLINNVSNVLFRCVFCYRAFHFHHLPAKTESILENADDNQLASDRFGEYCHNWACHDCDMTPAEIDSMVAWRPTNQDEYRPGMTTENVEEDGKEYLIRWKTLSHRRNTWMPGAWVWGVASSSMRKAFEKRNGHKNLPKMSFEDAVPEEFQRIDIVLDVEYTNLVSLQIEEVDMLRAKEVKKALVKFKGLGYEDVVWDEPPDSGETDRWMDFRTAYEDWVKGRYIRPPSQSSLNTHLKKVRAQEFTKNVELTSQPKTLVGGELMKYQLDGLNWLYYHWHQLQNGILADEMGLGKTIQIIGLLAMLKYLHGCWPFLIVVPNSTCPNWRREIKLWAPSLRVVTYFGSSEARRLSFKYELFPNKTREMRCHVVITSYDTAQDVEFRSVFRGIHWQGLFVDEGQRLKNDRNILYSNLGAMKFPFKILLTGTPLQNNARELFNLLQFLNPAINASEMELEYETLTKENVPKLHELLRPYFLRRTKAQVLTFLPAMAQIIIPVTLSVLQRKLYKSILAKNTDLLRAIFGSSKRALKQNERASLSNILMQLRKCLCHPFVYNRGIEERSSNAVISHKTLVEASSKLRLLEVMLPKLQERGHRVLIFSQFLNMLDIIEDFLDGLGLFYQRLDGSISALQKQKRIDEFNAPDSPLFAFLLSTRAGGIGINLATADTVIILDPDFNPHQDIQALSRAHRIGQKKKVLVFQLMTRATAEEKIMQIGRKKMALDHVLIDQMDAEDDVGLDLESILRHGTEALFQDDESQDIIYDSSSVDKLLDRSQVEKTDIAKDQSAESQFSFARVWANDQGILEEGIHDESVNGDTYMPDASTWEKILQEREAEVAREEAEKAEGLGRGKRQRQVVDYKQDAADAAETTPVKTNTGGKNAEGSDTDFEARAGESEESADEQDRAFEADLTKELQGTRDSSSRSKYGVFKRAEVPPLRHPPHIPLLTAPHLHLPPSPHPNHSNQKPASQVHVIPRCLACSTIHLQGSCPLKLAGVEYCGLCGQAHYGGGQRKACPHLHSLEQCQAMLEALKQSPEPRELKDIAKKYLVGIIGNIRHDRKMAEELQQQQQQRNGVTGVTNGGGGRGGGQMRHQGRGQGQLANGIQTPNARAEAMAIAAGSELVNGIEREDSNPRNRVNGSGGGADERDHQDAMVIDLT